MIVGVFNCVNNRLEWDTQHSYSKFFMSSAESFTECYLHYCFISCYGDNIDCCKYCFVKP